MILGISSANAINTRGIDYYSKKQKNSVENRGEFNDNRAAKTTSPSPQALQAYYSPSFGSKRERKKDIKLLHSEATVKTKDILTRASNLARKHGHKEIGYLHLMSVIYGDILKYMDDLDSGKKSYGERDSFMSPVSLEAQISKDMFKKEDIRKKIKPIFKKELEHVNKMLSEQKSSLGPKTTDSWNNLLLSEELCTDIRTVYDDGVKADDEDDEMPVSGVTTRLTDAHLLDALLWPEDDDIKDEFSKPFRMKLKKAVMIDTTPQAKRPHLKFYDDVAGNIWNNLAAGTNMFVLNEKNVDSKYLINSVLQLSGQQKGKFSPENTSITVLNKYADNEILFTMLHEAKKDKSKNHVFVFDIDKLDANIGGDFDYSNDLSNNIEAEFYKKPVENIRFVIVQDRDTYYKNNNSTNPENPFKDFGSVDVPIISPAQAKRTFREEAALLKDIKKPFSEEAIDRVIEATVPIEGYYPEKALRVMKLIAARYVDKQEVTAEDVQKYVKEAKHIFRTDIDDSSSVKVIFDTGKKLSDIVGPNSARKEAESIARMLKDGSIGTKGYIIYSQDGYPGSGRKHMAQVIAGETGVPYVKINALDFGTKEVDLFGFGNQSPEASIKKLFGLIRSQAETNPLRGAVLFIENFEYFSVGEQVSEYHQKAMAQLFREMDNAQEMGLNIVIMGSTAYPDEVDESTMKSLKFIDKIEIESPSRDTEARFEILQHYIKKKGLRVAGESEEEKLTILRNAAETTRGFPYVLLLGFLDKAKNVAKERSHEAIERADFIEAYLQTTTGRPSSKQDSLHRKEMVTSHECGHAITAQVMYDLFKQEGVMWRLPDKLNFITLDPRGVFGGAMFPKESENEEYNFEKVFSDLVCDFGGYSCEKHFYGQDGSWGISGDMENAAENAYTAVTQMGLGPKTGKIAVFGDMLGRPNVSEKKIEAMEDDVDVLVKNATYVSDKIVKTYEDFIKEFTERHKGKVGTGECIISSDEFQAHLNEWKMRQNQIKQTELEKLNGEIKTVMEKTKKGELQNK